MSSFSLYLLGFLLVTAGLAYGAYVLGAPPLWIGIGVVVLVGIAVARGATHTRRRDIHTEQL